MCSATAGASAVYFCTCAASAIFSYGSRGVPGVVKTLNRVPELPKAQLGSSMACLTSWSWMCWGSVLTVFLLSCGVRMSRGARCSALGVERGELVFEVEDLGESRGARVGAAVEGNEKGGHVGLPRGGARIGLEGALGRLVVVGLVVADEQAVFPEE